MGIISESTSGSIPSFIWWNASYTRLFGSGINRNAVLLAYIPGPNPIQGDLEYFSRLKYVNGKYRFLCDPL